MNPGRGMAMPKKFIEMFEKNVFSSLATIMEDGSPHVVPVWVGIDGEYIITAGGIEHVRHANMKRDPDKLGKRFNPRIKPMITSNKSDNKANRRSLQLPSKSITSFYGLIAVLLVLIPEWLAEGTIFISKTISAHKIPKEGMAWHLEDELRLASMSIFNLRKLAKEAILIGYSSENRFLLTKRILKKLNKKSNVSR